MGFDMVQSPWGPGRKSSGEAFKSAAVSATEGPLRWKWKDFSVAVGGQYFARSEIRTNVDFRNQAEDHTIGLDHRARLTVRASAKERIGVVVDFQDARAWGTEASTVAGTALSGSQTGLPSGPMATTGLHQGYVDVKAADFLDVRVGRQELSYGEDRLIGNLDWPQSARSFDGLFLRFTGSPSITLDAFGMMLRPPGFITGVDATGAPTGGRYHNSGSYFAGLYGRGRFGKAGIDIYGLGLLEDPATNTTGSRRDNNRFTVGGRIFGTLGGLALVGEGAFQTGKVGLAGDALVAGAVAAKATYTLDMDGKPYIMGEFSAASGDGDPTDGTEYTFHQLFPTGHAHLGYMDYVGWQNVVAGRGTIGFRPMGAHVWLDVHHFRSWDPKGAWYNAGGAIFLAADATRTSGNMGTEINFNVTIPIIANVAVAGNFSTFLPGMEAKAKGVDPSFWGFLSVRSQF